MIRRAVISTFVVYIVFGLPDGVFGTTWPNLRDDFSRTDGSFGWLVFATAAGYMVGSVSADRVADRMGLAPSMIAAMTVAAGALGTIAGAPTWIVVMLGYVVLGTGWGMTDAAMNAWIALTQGPRAMGMLHASYGVGAFAGPLVATAFVAGSSAWRGPYVVCTLLTVLAIGSLVGSRQGFAVARTTPEIAESGEPDGANRALILLVAWFAVYVGVEVAVGSWLYTLLTEGRDYSDRAAGLFTASFWGGLMAGRFVLAVVGHRLHPERTIRASIVGAAVATAILWIDPAGAGGLGATLFGLALSTMFPLAMGRTAVYVGETRAIRAVGYQIGATPIGFTGFSALIGVLADRHGVVNATLPVVGGGVLVMGVLWAMLERHRAVPVPVVESA